MASSWTTSWGTSWADSWGTTATAPTTSAWGGSWACSWLNSWGACPGSAPAVPTTTDTSGGRGKWKPRRREILTIKIDGEEFEVRDEQEAFELLSQAQALAAEVAPKRLPPPKIKLVAPDYSNPLTQQVQAQVDVTSAAIAALFKAFAAEEPNEDEVPMLLLTGML